MWDSAALYRPLWKLPLEKAAFTSTQAHRRTYTPKHRDSKHILHRVKTNMTYTLNPGYLDAVNRPGRPRMAAALIEAPWAWLPAAAPSVLPGGQPGASASLLLMETLQPSPPTCGSYLDTQQCLPTHNDHNQTGFLLTDHSVSSELDFF